MTHIENIPHILQYGITHSTSINANRNYKSIGDSTLISARSKKEHLGASIPFYFGKRMPMLFVIQGGHLGVPQIHPENIVYCVTTVHKIIELKLDFMFTSGHAVSRLTTKHTANDVQNINDLIDWKAVDAKYWISETDPDLKRKKEAEFLILGDIPLYAVIGYIVYNEEAKDKMVAFGIPDSIVKVNNEDYF